MSMYKIFAICLNLFCLYGFSQTNLKNSDLEIDTSLTLKHYVDSIVILEYINLKNEFVTDTIYSCNFDLNGKIKSERISNNGSQNGVHIYNYDTLSSKLLYDIFYEETQTDNKNEALNIRVRKFFYNSFDSVSKIESFSFCKTKTLRKIVNLLPCSEDTLLNGYCKWSWNYDGYILNSFNNKRQKSIVRNFDKHDMTAKWTFEYDNSGRLINETWCDFEFKDLQRDSNKCQQYHKVNYKYTDKLIFRTDSFFIGENIEINKHKICLNDFRKPRKIIQKSIIINGNLKPFKKDSLKILTSYYYDSYFRLIKSIEKFDDTIETKYYKYICN